MSRQVAYKLPGAQVADWVDLYNRLYRERIIFLGQEINDELANQVVGVMLYLDSEDNTKPVFTYINSPGGSVTAGFAMFDTMRHIKSEVSTINVGLAASMGSFLLAGGSKGKRLMLPHARTMIHQPMGGSEGQVTWPSRAPRAMCPPALPAADGQTEVLLVFLVVLTARP